LQIHEIHAYVYINIYMPSKIYTMTNIIRDWLPRILDTLLMKRKTISPLTHPNVDKNPYI